MKLSNITLGQLDMPDIGENPEDFWRPDQMFPDVRPVVVSYLFGRPLPDLSDCLARRLPGRPWLLQLWEPLRTKAPSPSRCQPYCCYIKTVIFYHKPYISRRGKPWWSGDRWHWIPGPAGFEQFDQVEARLTWDDVVRFHGDEFAIAGGRVAWRRQRWWMMRTARRKRP